MLSAWFKSKTADKVLAPLRDELIELIDNHTRLLEVGCGTGALLFAAAPKIDCGYGVDLNKSMIHFANTAQQKRNIRNLHFIHGDVKATAKHTQQPFHIATSTLCLHEMTEANSITTLKQMAQHAPKIIIADYTQPKTQWGKISLELDEFISGHYTHFKHYRANGGLPYLAQKANLNITMQKPSCIDAIDIWTLQRL